MIHILDLHGELSQHTGCFSKTDTHFSNQCIYFQWKLWWQNICNMHLNGTNVQNVCCYFFLYSWDWYITPNTDATMFLMK